MSKPIKIPRDLKPGDILVCNLGERLGLVRYDGDGDAVTDAAKDGCAIWRRNGRNWTEPLGRWIVAIERLGAKTEPTTKSWTVTFASRAKAHQAAKAFGGKLQRGDA